MTAPLQARATRYPVLLAMCAAALVAGIAFWPALHAGITPEDFGWLVASRQLESPWPFIADNPFFVYFYRPLPLLVWWLSGQAFGAQALAHNALDLALLALDAALVSRLAWRISGRISAAWIAGLAFACLPCAVGTALWMSDRFDPVALAFGLGALLAFERALASSRAAPLFGLLLLGAMLSKETAYAVAAWLLLRLLLRAWRRRERRIDLWLALLLPITAALGLRHWAGTSLDSSVPVSDLPAALSSGVLAWWQRVPHALLGFTPSVPGNPPGGWIALALILVVVVASLHALAGPKARAPATLFLTGAALVLATPLLQWPITRLALAPDGYALTLNLRFYFPAGAGLALLLGASASALVGWRRVVSLLLIGALCIGGLAGARTTAAAWTTQFASDGARHLVLSRELAARDWPAGCRIVLDAPDFDDGFRLHADIIAKAAATRGAPLMRCAVFAGTRAYITVVDAALCRDDAWPGLSVTRSNGVPQIARLGNVCTLQFAEPPAPDDPLALRLRVDANGHLQEIP